MVRELGDTGTQVRESDLEIFDPPRGVSVYCGVVIVYYYSLSDKSVSVCSSSVDYLPVVTMSTGVWVVAGFLIIWTSDKLLRGTLQVFLVLC